MTIYKKRKKNTILPHFFIIRRIFYPFYFKYFKGGGYHQNKCIRTVKCYANVIQFHVKSGEKKHVLGRCPACFWPENREGVAVIALGYADYPLILYPAGWPFCGKKSIDMHRAWAPHRVKRALSCGHCIFSGCRFRCADRAADETIH